MMAGLLLIGVFQMILLAVLLLLMYAPALVVLVDIYKGHFKQNKWMWFVIVLLFNYPGIVFYLLIGRQEKIK